MPAIDQKDKKDRIGQSGPTVQIDQCVRSEPSVQKDPKDLTAQKHPIVPIDRLLLRDQIAQSASIGNNGPSEVPPKKSIPIERPVLNVLPNQRLTMFMIVGQVVAANAT
ncbi:MAG: hypothetical protein ABL921_06920 [Pirellula sp.]